MTYPEKTSIILVAARPMKLWRPVSNRSEPASWKLAATLLAQPSVGRLLMRMVCPLVVVALLLAAGCQPPAPTIPVRAQDQPDSVQTVASPTAAPHVVVRQPIYDAGDVDFGKLRNCPFIILNSGGQPLHLTVLRKSCLCADVVVPAEIPPGKEDKVLLRWTPIAGKTGPYTFTIELQTNDPQSPSVQLQATGNVNPSIRVWPEDRSIVDFEQIRPGTATQRTLKVFSTKLDNFSLEATTTSSELKVTSTRLPANTLVDDIMTRCTYAVVLKPSDKLPPGYLRETLTLSVKVPGEDARSVVLLVYGEIANSVLQVTPQIVTFQKAKLADGDAMKVRVQFFVPNDGQQLRIAHCEPDFLTCDQPKRLPQAGLWEFIVRIPANNPAAMKLQPDGSFEGRIVLGTTNPEAQMIVRVNWSPPEK